MAPESEPAAPSAGAEGVDWQAEAEVEIRTLVERLAAWAGGELEDQSELQTLRNAYTEALQYCRHLETEYSASQEQLADKLAQEADLRRSLTERMQELDIIHGEIRALQADQAVKDAYTAQLRDTIAQLEAAYAAVTNRAAYRLLLRAEASVRSTPLAMRAAKLLLKTIRRR